MRMIKACLGFALLCASACSADTQQLVLPAGFSIEQIASVKGARQMALSDNGTLFVGTQREGEVSAIARIGQPDQGEVVQIAEKLKMPSGVAWHRGRLYVGAVNRILVFDDIENNLHPSAPHRVLTEGLPDKQHHGWKYLKFGPSGELYVPVGAPCNVCAEEDERFASILTMNPQSGTTSVFASGIRNTVGFDWHPVSGELWFTDNGRDMLGDDIPAEEVNRAPKAGLHFGFPYIHAGDIPDPVFGSQRGSREYVAPEIKIQAHSAALGAVFYKGGYEHGNSGGNFPAKYTNALFVAEHGSWNRSSKVGYQVGVVTFDEYVANYQPFVTGWLQDQKNWGRPNDVLVLPDGSLLISDDQAGAIYQVRYQEPQAPAD